MEQDTSIEAQKETHLTIVGSDEKATQRQTLSGGISPLAWHIFVLAWLVFIAYEVYNLLQTHLSLLRLEIVLGTIFCFIALYSWLVWPHPLSFQAQARARSNFIWLPFVLLVGLTIFLNLAYGGAWIWDFIFCAVVAGVIFPSYRAGPAILALVLITLGMGRFLFGADWEQFLIPIILVAGVGSGMAGLVSSFSTIRELQLARSELARLAVMEERFRLARDLHDLLGHKLSMITLKSELAGRLIDKAPERAVKEVHDIEQVARQTLHEVREAVAGYRQPRLESELETARQMLETAGIACSIIQEVEALPATADALLAWTIREGVTNVIRHSRAQQCAIRLGWEQERVFAEVVNDGYQERDKGWQEDGTGLTGIAERVAIMGGSFAAGPCHAGNSQRFCLRIELPLLKIAGNVKE
ncbi:MAG TPA: histidine kinase [Ktedonobacteraceae bacterium]